MQHPDSAALATIPSASSSSSRTVHRSPAQTSVVPLLRDSPDTEQDDHPVASSLDPEFPQSGEDSLRRKNRQRSLFRRDQKRRPSIVASLIGQYDADHDHDHDHDDGASPSPPQEQARILDPAVASSPVKILVAPHHKSPTLARDPGQRTASRQAPLQQVPIGSPEDLVPIDVFAEDAGERIRAQRQVAELVQEEATQVRDVLYENQRGILFRGVPYFSAMSLFPFDPDAWSLVNPRSSYTSVRPTTAQAAAQHPSLHNTSRSHTLHRHSARMRRAGAADMADHDPSFPPLQNTPFTPASFQLPSPAWRYVGPWSVAMQTDGRTDEHGWEYNWIFKSRGWHAHVNTVGWAGWVRRRKWTRLREYSEASKES